MEKSRVQAALAGVYLFLMPLMMVGVLSFWATENRRQADAVERRATLEEIVTNIARQSRHEAYFQEYAQRLVRRLTWDGHLHESPGISATSAIRLFVFNEKGKRMMVPGATPGLVYASEQVWGLLQRVSRDRSLTPTKRENTVLESFLGTAVGFEELLKRPGTLAAMDSSAVGGDLAGVFPFASTTLGKGSLLVLVETRRVNSAELAKRLLRTARIKTGKECAFGMLDLLEKPSAPGASMSLPDELRRGRRDKTFRRGPYWVSSEVVARRYIVYGVCRVQGLVPKESENTVGAWIFAGFWVMIWGVWLIGSRRWFQPLRLVVIGLFALAGVANVLALLEYAASYRLSWETSQIREAFARSRDRLQSLDHGFSAALARREAQYRRLLTEARGGALTEAVIIQRLRRFKAFRGKVFAALVEKNGTYRYRLQPRGWFSLNDYWGKDVRKVIAMIGTYALRRQFREHYEQRHAQENLIDTSGDALSAIAIDSALHLCRLQDTFFPVRTGQRQILLFPAFWKDEHRRSRAFLLLAHEWRFLEEWFLRRELKRRRQFGRARNERWVAVPAEKTASWMARDETLRRFHVTVNQAQQPDWRILTRGGKRWLLTGYPARHLEGYNLFLATPMAPLDAALTEFVRRLSWGAAILLIFSGILAAQFAELLLEPLERVSEGVRQLASGNFQEKIRVASGDEFEHLGDEINEILEEVKEIATAHKVHDQLFPGAELVCGSLICRGWFNTARELGGGYYDYLALGEGRAAIWLVQAQGAKLSGALGLANSKMALRLLFQGNPESPGRVLQQYQSRFSDVVAGRTSSLRLFIGVLDEPRKCLTFVNPGGFRLRLAGPDGFHAPEIENVAMTTDSNVALPDKFSLEVAFPEIAESSEPAAGNANAPAQAGIRIERPEATT